MAKNRISACWLLLMTLLFAAACVLGTGQAQARYTNTVTWNTVMDESVDQDQVTSDFLENVANPPVTILLNELVGEEYEVNFTLKSGVSVVGPLNWAVDRYEYVEAIMTVGEGENAVTLQPGDDLAIPADNRGITVTMTLRPTTKAMTENHPAMDVNIQVAWGDTLRGTFLTFLNAQDFGGVIPELPDVTDPTEPETTDPTDPTEPETTDPTDPTEPETTDPTDPTEPETTDPTDPTEPETTDPTDPIQQDTDPTEPSEPEQTQPTDPVEPDTGSESQETQPEEPDSSQEEQTDTSNLPEETIKSAAITYCAPEPVLGRKSSMKTYLEDTETPAAEEGTGEDSDGGDSTDESTEGDGTTGEEPAGDETSDETEVVIPDPKVEITTLRSFKTDNVLLVEVQMCGTMSTIEFGMGFRDDPETEDGIEPIPFPRHLRYSLDGGTSYYHLYQDSLIHLTPSPDGVLYVLLDWSRVGLTVNELELSAAACYEGEMVASDRTTTAPQIQYAVTVSSRILDTSEPLVIQIPQSWQGYTLEYEVQMLTSPLLADGSYGPAVYQTLDLGEDAEDPETPSEDPAEDPTETEDPSHPTEEPAKPTLILELTDAGLEIRLGEELPPAGTYRINMNWMSGDTSVEEAQVIFYINYSANQETLLTGGAEQ